jgi:hypothetical protein
MAGTFTPEQVAEAFRAILGSNDVRDDDDWFDIGGTSLTGLTLVVRLNKASGVKLRLRDIVRAPTPKALAAEITARLADPQEETRE